MSKIELELKPDALLELSPDSVGDFADRVINTGTLLNSLDGPGPFFWRRELCEFLGIGESTLTGWLKADRIPRAAKVAYALLEGLTVLQDEVRRLRRETGYPKVLKDGEQYLVVKFPSADVVRFLADNTDFPAGKIADATAGEIVARDIADAKTALQLAASFRAFELLEEASSTLEGAQDYLDEPGVRNDVTRVQKNISSWGQAFGLMNPELPAATETTSDTEPTDEPEGADSREGDQ